MAGMMPNVMTLNARSVTVAGPTTPDFWFVVGCRDVLRFVGK
jgi:hypothetical protein